MSQPLHPNIPPATAADIRPEWIAQVREALQRDGQAARAGELHAPAPAGELLDGRVAFTIEVQSINTGLWQPLNLPSNTIYFATASDRDAVLEQLWRAPR